MSVLSRTIPRVALGFLLAFALPVAASAATINLFSKAESIRLTSSNGRVLDLNKVRISAGDRLDESDLDYSGTATHHSGRPIGSDHLGCVVITLPDTVCNAQYAIAGSMLLTDAFAANFTRQNPFPSVPISDGTGRYAGAHGLVKIGAVGMTNNANFTITYTP